MALLTGVLLGPYRIIEKLGEGGMGEVHRARDTRLGRDVAIKVLPELAAADADRRARFEREAKAVAALNHPNIVTIHAVEDADGIPYFAMEYVEGRTLAQLIPPRGLPLGELLRIAIPLADAIAAAHQRGILHRDLKPANVMVGCDGRVKVLDFGLAKLKETAIQANDLAPTAETTGEGRILGTAAYMSPEQAEGKPLDQRSDIFSLGVLLYEMATGQRPFKGDTSVSVISAILKDTPGSVTGLRPDLPRDLARILKRALNKDPEHRYQTAKDLRNDLETLKEDLDSGEVGAGSARAPGISWPRGQWAAAVVILGLASAAAAGVSWWLFASSGASRALPAGRRPFEDFTLTPLATEGVYQHAVAISADGRYVAYASIEASGQALRVRQVETSATVQVVSPANVVFYGLSFSPDGNRLYYVVYPPTFGMATLYEVPVLGGTPRRVLDDVDRSVSFSPDGTRLAFVRGVPGKSSSILIANADGTEEHVLARREYPEQFSLVGPAWSADGRSIAAAVHVKPANMMIVTIDAATGTVQALGSKKWGVVADIQWPRGKPYLIVAAAGDFVLGETWQLWEVGVADGAARRITKDMAWYSRASLTADARTLVTVQAESRRTVWVAPSSQLDRPARIAAVPDTLVDDPIRWTPDGRIVYSATVGGNTDVWSVRSDGTDVRQLTTSPGFDGRPSVAPDGRSVVFVSNRTGQFRVWRMDPDGGRQAIITGGPADYYPVVSGDSRSVYFNRLDQQEEPMYIVPTEGGPPTLLCGPASIGRASWPGVPGTFRPHAVSPDGSRLIGNYYDYQLTPTASLNAVVRVGGEGVVSRLPRTDAEWAPDGRALTFARAAQGSWNLWRQALDAAAPTRLTNYGPGEPITYHAWSRDGRMLAFVRAATQRRLVLVRDLEGGR